MARERLTWTPARLAASLVLAITISLTMASAPVAADDEEPTPTPTATRAPAASSTPTPSPTRSSGPTPTPAPTPTPTETTPAEQPPAAPIYPLAVMVDNFPSSRPQTGLGAADIVYEALAEGGITRFLAIYASRDPELVGPVRSARHYYVYWAAEYNAPLVHVMASDEGYAALVNTGLPDLGVLSTSTAATRASCDRMIGFRRTTPTRRRPSIARFSRAWARFGPARWVVCAVKRGPDRYAGRLQPASS